MPRARSIWGLVLQLAAVYARLHPRWCAAGCLGVAATAIALLWPHAHPAPHGLTAAVLRDGFVVDQPTGTAAHQVIELDRDGAARRTTLLSHAEDLRVVGTNAGAVAGWQDGAVVRLARVDQLDHTESWGKRVRQLCAGVASNDLRFGISWVEYDDTVWVVHGPLTPSATDGTTAAEALAAPGALARVQWCGVASAEKSIALLWRSGDLLSFTMCRRQCSGLVANVRIDHRVALLGVGCLDGGCLIASRNTAGAVQLDRLTESGRRRWSKPLDATGPSVSVVGLGAQVFVVGVASARGAEVLRFERDGSSRSVWQDPAGTTAPALSWSSGKLLVAYARGDELVHRTIALPR